jgi:hypothetical protein
MTTAPVPHSAEHCGNEDHPEATQTFEELAREWVRVAVQISDRQAQYK